MRFESYYASVLNERPLVLAQYDADFERHHVAIADELSTRGIDRCAIFVQLGWEHETPERADNLAASVKDFLSRQPSVEVTILCNTPLELERFTERGVRAVFCHQNAFLDESRYLILPGARRYDAVYLARVTPMKRHELLAPHASPRLLLLGAYYHPDEREYGERVLAKLRAARLVWRFRGLDVSRYLCSSVCGLMLSRCEGANFATAEYALCGLPVVNTPSIGGRELLSPEAYRTDVADDPDAIAQAIDRWVRNPPDPHAVRRAFLEMAEVHRETLRNLIGAFTGKRPKKFPHKLGLRTPPQSFARRILSKLYLRGVSIRATLEALFHRSARSA